MTVKELMDYLKTLPQEAIICRKSDEYKDAEVRAVSLEYRPNAGFGILANSILIS